MMRSRTRRGKIRLVRRLLAVYGDLGEKLFDRLEFAFAHDSGAGKGRNMEVGRKQDVALLSTGLFWMHELPYLTGSI